MAQPINNTLRNFSVYNGADGNKQVGLAHIVMPTIENISEVLKGSGITGEPDVPVLGHVRNMTAQFHYHTLTPDGIALIQQTNQVLNCRATLQSYQPQTAAFGVVPERVLINGFPRSLNLGRWEVASKSDLVVVELNVHYIKVFYDGASGSTAGVIEIDPFNSVYAVNGVNYLAADITLL